MKKGLIICCILCSFALSFPEESAKKVLLLPFAKGEQTAGYSLSSAIDQTLFSSYFNYLSIFTFLDLPEQEELLSLSHQDRPELKLAQEQKADFIVRGEYSLSGNPQYPDLLIHVKVWSLAKRGFIMDKLVRTTVDLDIFDTIDQLASDTLIAAFQITSGFSTLDFSRIKTGKDTYDIFINNKKKATLTNENQEFRQKILGDTSYKVVIKHKQAGTVYKERLSVPSGQVKVIDYLPQGTVSIARLIQTQLLKRYTIKLDGEVIRENTQYKNITAAREHTLVVQTNSKVITSRTFYLADQQKIKLSPEAGYISTWYFGLSIGLRSGDLLVTNHATTDTYTSSGSLIDLSLSAYRYILPRLTAGAALGYYWQGNDLQQITIGMWDFSLEVAFQLLGDQGRPFKLFTGVYTDLHLYSINNQTNANILSSSPLLAGIDFGFTLDAQFRNGFFLKLKLALPHEKYWDLNPYGVNGIFAETVPSNGHLSLGYRLGI